ncbi:hypothetical protein HanPSC8_Chr07g0271001 [Helianthus annuus]|nr:hypothetical protein HanPSC8_Chr07g0271001 [Helianthus annuus]
MLLELISKTTQAHQSVRGSDYSRMVGENLRRRKLSSSTIETYFISKRLVYLTSR